MINFVELDIDAHEKKFVRRSLEYAKGMIESTEAVEQCIAIGFNLPLFKAFSKEDVIKIFDDLLQMHADAENVYFITDYHFLVLHQVIRMVVTRHNEAVLQGATPILMDSNFTINEDELVERLFHDVDFLLTADEFNALAPEERGALEMSPELFSICNNLPPHPDELKSVSKPLRKKKKGHSL